ncbi:Protein-ribulosamine 3-kinase [Apiospora arundinis]|uniref:protein-ribulosamine 3-kinase n=1 Tax=Apiospora arundinis TaxID=335852 RepID=A0ABR2IIB9_9PEZI
MGDTNGNSERLATLAAYLQASNLNQPLLDFPEGSKFISIKLHGASFWTHTARIDLELADDKPYRLLMETATGDVGMSMIRGEYHVAEAIHKFNPEGIPCPVAWGTYSSDPNKHFYLCEFMDMIEELPDIRKFSSMLAKLHQDSMAAPDYPGHFGFHVMTHEGRMYQDVT